MRRLQLILFICLLSFNIQAQKKPHKDTVAVDLWIAKAFALEKKQQWDSALFYFEKAAVAYEKIGDTLNHLYAEIYMAKMDISANRKEIGISKLNFLLNDYATTVEEDAQFGALIFCNIGGYYARTGDFSEVLKYCHKALDIYESGHLEIPNLINEILSMLSNTYRRVYKYQEAAFYAHKWVKINQKNPLELAHAYNSLGLAYSRQYNHQKSIDAFKKCLELRKVHAPDWVPFIINNIGLQYQRMKDYDSAHYWYDYGLKLCDEIYDRKILINSVLKANTAFNFNDQGMYKSAIVNLKESIDIRKEWVKDNQLIESQLYLMALLVKAGQKEEAEKILTEVDGIIGSSEISTIQSALANNAYGSYYLKTDQPSKALSYFSQALRLNIKQEDQSSSQGKDNEIKYADDYAALTSISGEIMSLGQINKHQENTETYKDMVRYFNKIKTLLKRFGSSQKEPFGFSQFIQGKSELRQVVMESAGILYETTGDDQYIEFMADLMESARMNLLKEQLRYEEMVKFSHSPDSLIKKRQQLLAESYFYQQKDINPERLYEIDNELYNINALLKEKAKGYHQLLVESDSSALSKVKKHLNKDQIILQFNFIGNKLFLLSHTRVKDDFRIIDWTQEHDAIIQQLQAGMTENNKYAIDRYRRKLAKILDLEGILPLEVKELIIVPDGKLSSIPFEILPYKGQQYLLEKLSVRYASGVSDFKRNYPTDKKDIAILAFAPFSGKDSDKNFNTTRTANELDRSSLSELPATKDEVTTISRLLSGTPLLGNEANEMNFKALAPRAEIIHLATHSIVNDKNPLYNKILFSSDVDDVEDGNLHTYELFNLNLNADLVTLSACNTGVGKYYTGEGMLGLATGFKFAGVPNLLISLWSVPDATTSRIMGKFYFYLNEGLSKSDALRQAKLDYLASTDRNTASPYYWAGFVLNGEINAQESNKMAFQPAIFLSMVFTFSLILLGLRKKRYS